MPRYLFMPSFKSIFIHSSPCLRLIIHSDGELIVKTELAFEKKGFFLDFMTKPLQIVEDQMIQYAKSYALGRSLALKLKCNIDHLSPFTSKVVQSLTKIPRGSAWSYEEMARYVGSLRAARAVGNACRVNPFPLIYPCHRVVGKHGIGGFAYGTEVKKILLDFERD